MKVLAIADNQLPFDHKDYLPFLAGVAKKHKVDRVVHVGDLVDQHALGQWGADPDGMSAGDELSKAIKRVEAYAKVFPKIEVCWGNHDERAAKRAYANGIPKRYMRPLAEVLHFPKGWNFVDYVVIDKVRYEHGIGYSGPMGAMKAALENVPHIGTVIGHLHSDAGIHYWANSDVLVFGMNVGSGIDRKQYAFNYGKLFKKKPILSCGVVLNGRPILETMDLDKRGRWTGKL